MTQNGITGIVNEIRTLNPEQEALKNLVLAKMQTLEQLKIKRRELKEKLESELLMSEEYKDTFKKADIEKKKLKLVKDKLAQDPNIWDLKEEIKEITKQYNETKKDISEFLVTFETQTGQLSFMDPTGNEVKIVRSAKPQIVKVDFKEKQKRGRR